MTLNPLSEVRYRYRLALDHLRRARRMVNIEDWAGVVQSSQLAVENFAKSIIAIFEVPTWSHDPSTQLHRLKERAPESVRSFLKRLAEVSSELAPEHGRSSYGEPSRGLTPSDIYRRRHAMDSLRKAEETRKIVDKILKELGVHLNST